MRNPLRLLLAILFAGAAVPASAQVPRYPEAVRAAVHRIFATRDFAAQRFGPARFIQGGAAYTTVERAAEGGGSDIVKYESATGARSILVPAKAMTPAGATAPLAFDDYSWSEDGTRLLLFTNTERVWRSNTRGDYWVLTLATGQLQKLGGDAPARR
jgi:dipeptidyl-peptidase-4